MSTKDVKHPKGYWMGVGISLGLALGAAFGLALDNLGAGIGMGVAIGAGMGAALEQRNRDNLRPLTERERARQKQSITIGLAVIAILAVLLAIVYFLQAK